MPKGYTANILTTERDKIFIHLPQTFTKTQVGRSILVISANLFKYANYLIKYARYKNVPSRNGFYGKKYLRIN
jgi:hypothetical protein